ncbi:lipid A deacylase LpxR family protein [Shewanella canadensis]|uniref:Lipid A deacylase LpxR family protein n=1 Tax=Shewanella canadensis TaxID=271096 RepID=A0A3S0KU21_9GAMM|nr:lipid A deacylase LpxR family protein [Shewanella canadensis]RTR38425.1 lipid A deacylase LpxR family protein [Shewanella canadensis]
MNYQVSKRFISTSFLLLISPWVSAGQWYLQVDNDFVFSDDGNYTNGLMLGWESAPVQNLDDTTSPIRWQSLFSFKQNDAEQAWGVKLTQQMWTPGEIEIETPQPYDRPYAGYLAFESHTATYGKNWAQKNWLSLGILGPASGTEQLQEVVHKLTGSSTPNGWQHQIENQFTVQIAYEVDALILRRDAFNNAFIGETQWELSGFSHSQAGNFRSETDLGLTFRWGTNLSDSFGRLSQHTGQFGNISATAKSSNWIFFTRAYLGYRFNDLTIDGSLSYDSHVELENNQAGVTTGIIWSHPSWSLAWSFNAYTKEYQSDTDEWHGYGSLIISWQL